MADERCVYENVLRDASSLCEEIFVKLLTILLETTDHPNLPVERIFGTVVQLFRWISDRGELHVRHAIPERPKGGGHLAAMNCVGELQRVLHQCCGILVKPLSAFFGYPPFDLIFKFLLMALFSHEPDQLSHHFLL